MQGYSARLGLGMTRMRNHTNAAAPINTKAIFDHQKSSLLEINIRILGCFMGEHTKEFGKYQKNYNITALLKTSIPNNFVGLFTFSDYGQTTCKKEDYIPLNG